MKGTQLGAALSLDTPIPTPKGWATMGDIKVGDIVFDEKGKQCEVLFVTDIMEGHDCYEITFSDGTKIKADKEHQWTIKKRIKNKKEIITINTEEIYKTYNHKGRNIYSIPTCEAIECNSDILTINPYVLGVWLGDGNSMSAQITGHKDDLPEIAEYIKEKGHNVILRQKDKRDSMSDVWNLMIDPKDRNPVFCKRGHDLKKHGRRKGRCRICGNQFSNNHQRGTPIDPIIAEENNSLYANLRKLKLLNNKHIPPEYLRAKAEDRLALLQGLMDTDGYCSKNGLCEFSNINKRLAEGVFELAISLGLQPRIKEKHPKKRISYAHGRLIGERQLLYTVQFISYSDIPVFRLKRKIARQRDINDKRNRLWKSRYRRIVSVKATKSVPVKCISVSSVSSLYLASKAMIATHNTEIGLCWVGYIVHYCPGPCMFVQPTVDMAKRVSKQRLSPMLETATFHGIINPARERDSGNSMLAKEFRGGVMIITGANSAAGLRSMPVRFLFLDEVDAYPFDIDNEGDPVAIAIKRTSAFYNSKIFITSTPTIRGSSRIEREYEESDQRSYYVPCIHCGEMQTLQWANIKFEYEKVSYRLKADPFYVCHKCGGIIEEHNKTYMLANGRWIAKYPDVKVPGFILPGLYSPIGWFSWKDGVEDHLLAKKKRDRMLRKTWANTFLAETYEDDGERVSENVLFNRREAYKEIPEGVIILCASCDIQKDRIEVLITGWGIGQESWAIEHFCLYGDTSIDPKIRGGVWDALHGAINKTYQHEQGYTWRIGATTIDTGYETDNVYKFVRARQETMKVFAIKGANTDKAGVPIITKPSKTIPDLDLYHIGTHEAKMSLFNRLKMEEYGPGYMHFNQTFTEDFFKQLAVEKIITKYKNGFPYKVFEKPEGARNEACDLAVYNIACVMIALSRANTTLERIAEQTKAQVVERERNIPAPRPQGSGFRKYNKGIQA